MADYADANEFHILNYTRVCNAIKNVGDYQGVEIPANFPPVIEEQFRDEVERFIRVFGILKFENPDESWWRILKSMVLEFKDQNDEIANFVSIIEKIKANKVAAEKK
jgi:hypothetical protein